MTDGERLLLTILGVGGVVAVGSAIASAFDDDDDGDDEWLAAEKRACKRRGRRHLGGPGRDDCDGGVEVKHWTSRPVHAGVIRREAAKGRMEVVSSGGMGFTDEAFFEAERLGVLLAEK